VVRGEPDRAAGRDGLRVRPRRGLLGHPARRELLQPRHRKDHASYAFNSYSTRRTLPRLAATSAARPHTRQLIQVSSAPHNHDAILTANYSSVTRTAQILDKPYVSHGAFFSPSVQVQDLAGIHPQGKQNIYVPSKKNRTYMITRKEPGPKSTVL
jgi:hypothetical protein